MKTAAKVFIILGMIFLFYLIFPLVLGIIALQKIDNPKDKNELQTWGVITLILVSLLGGLFMLLIPDEEINGGRVVDAKATVNEAPSQASSSGEVNTNSFEYIEKLKELKGLYDSGAISEQEFIDLKAKLLNK